MLCTLLQQLTKYSARALEPIPMRKAVRTLTYRKRRCLQAASVMIQIIRFPNDLVGHKLDLPE